MSLLDAAIAAELNGEEKHREAPKSSAASEVFLPAPREDEGGIQGLGLLEAAIAAELGEQPKEDSTTSEAAGITALETAMAAVLTESPSASQAHLQASTAEAVPAAQETEPLAAQIATLEEVLEQKQGKLADAQEALKLAQTRVDELTNEVEVIQSQLKAAKDQSIKGARPDESLRRLQLQYCQSKLSLSYATSSGQAVRKTEDRLQQITSAAGVSSASITFGGANEQSDKEDWSTLPDRVMNVLTTKYKRAEMMALAENQVQFQIADHLGLNVSVVRQFGQVHEALQRLRGAELSKRLTEAADAVRAVSGSTGDAAEAPVRELRLAIASAGSFPTINDLKSLISTAQAVLEEHEAASKAARSAPKKSATNAGASDIEAACSAITSAVASGNPAAVKEAVAHAKKIGVPKKDIARANALGQA
mmetsp:Transcript_126878/g.224893  ORF Transcript_126878/g.224893 Transcript_126878/m.224893 type:complete len:422 (-) Transcript_126878:269-1534(-)